MDELSDKAILELGGWDARYVSVAAKVQSGDMVIAVIDDGGGGYIEMFHRFEGAWRSSGGSGPASAGGEGWTSRGGGIAHAWGKSSDSTVQIEFRGVVHTVPVEASGLWLFAANDVSSGEPLPSRIDDAE